MISDTSVKRFITFSNVSIFLTLFLVMVGGFVRATGSGLGCPDWPKCFGMWIPPISFDQLPVGFSPDQFNPLKTWIEYINRLIGVLIGFSILLAAGLSIPLRKKSRSTTVLSVAGLILVIVQGLIGATVVFSELEGYLITIHMVVAIAILFVLISANISARTTFLGHESLISPVSSSVFYTSVGLLVLTSVQIIVGTQVREQVDILGFAGEADRSMWLQLIGFLYEFHRSFSWLVLVGAIYLVRETAFRQKLSLRVQKWSFFILILIIAQFVIGVILDRFALPPAFQMLHLTSATALVCAQFYFVRTVKISE